MKTYLTYEELENLCDALIRDFLKSKHQTNVNFVDIEAFVTEYLGIQIRYDDFADQESKKLGFYSDGHDPVKVSRNNRVKTVVFPNKTVVIDRTLAAPNEYGRRRFTIAHEGAHYVIGQHNPEMAHAAYHSEFSAAVDYPRETLKRMMSLNETMANRAAACFLMPRFLVERAIRKYNEGNRIIVYEGMIISQEQRNVIGQIASDLGVNYSPLFTRLKELNLLEVRPVEDYLREKFKGESC